MADQQGNQPPDGRRARWAGHNLARRRLILDAAVAVTERLGPGAEVHVRQIADEAGIGRSVVYRHFADRSDLDRAVRAHVLRGLRDQLLPEVTLSGSIEQIIDRIVSSYVGWAAGHPALHDLAVRAPVNGADDTEFGATTKALVDEVVGVLTLGAAVLGVRLSEDDNAALEPLIFGLVGMAFGTVGRWLRLPRREPEPAALAHILARTIWHALDGHARERGVELDPTVPLDDLITGPAEHG